MPSKDPKLRFHSVSVVPGTMSCEAAKSLAGQRILSAQAPLLPLPDCLSPAGCTCTYSKFDDRRSGPRRASERGRFAAAWTQRDRRRRGGRRSTDD